MKKTFVTLFAVCVAVITLHAFRTVQSSGIKGAIRPVDATVSGIWAMSGTDTVKAQALKGNFVLQAKAGTWKLVVRASAPYKDAVMEGVEVKEGQITDVGEIKLPQ